MLTSFSNADADLDTSDPLTPDQASFYQHLIGVLRWVVEIGPIDIAAEVSILSSYLAYPRDGHLSTALFIMGYLKQKHNSRLVFDPTYECSSTVTMPEIKRPGVQDRIPYILQHGPD